ncbi:MAG: hypothetical protein L3J71_04745 [Victivallaceae bacterium]|nr:hypothetical protein [Victivallaceae bacterium]
MLKKVFSFIMILAVLCLNAGMLFAEDSAQAKKPVQRIFNRDVVTGALESIDDRIIKGDDNGNKLSYIFYRTYANKIRAWFKNPWMELDSRIAKSWYINLYNTFVRMGKAKRNLERLESQHKAKTAVYTFERKKFIAAYQQFKALQKEPTKLTRSRYMELKRAKAAWEKKEREKARAAARAQKRSSRS